MHVCGHMDTRVSDGCQKKSGATDIIPSAKRGEGRKGEEKGKGKERKGKGRKGKLDWVKRGIRAPCGAVYPEEHGEKR